MAALARAKRFDWSNLGVRAASAAVLVPAALWASVAGGEGHHPAFLVLISVAVALLSIEWGAMASPKAGLRIAIGMTIVILASVFVAWQGWYFAAWGVALLGAGTAAAVARGTSERPGDAALGVIYLAAPCLCLIWLREMPQGVVWILMLFAVTWAADICAFLVGSVLRGPKLWPRFSPNKTWSGFVGGLFGAMLAAILVGEIAKQFTDIKLWKTGAAAIGLAGGLATMAGDLWESMLKRRFGVKDSGDIIPGHGGLLDRVDGLMFSAIVLAIARLIDHLGWAH